MNDPIFSTRRAFLRTTLLGGVLSWTAPGFVPQALAGMHAQAEGAPTPVTAEIDGPILLLVRLTGGNDGLNAVVPFTNDYYHRARPSIGIRPEEAIKLSDTLGLNPGMTAFKHFFDAGHLSIINGVGYANPNRSHFRATEIWQTASHSDQELPHGWIGRYFDNACPGCDHTVGVSIGPRVPHSFSSRIPTGFSLETPESYRVAGLANNDGESAGTASLPSRHYALDFLERASKETHAGSDEIHAILAKTKSTATYPSNLFARKLQLVARLIAGGMPTRVFHVEQGGYDTHSDQRNAQDSRLQELGGSLKAFTEDLASTGHFGRVLIMTFSEFGRCVLENASGGTDHGAAAPMFLIGSKVKAGLLGTEPSLAPADLHEGGLKFNIDFRGVYASILQQWMNTDSVPILGKQFATLPLIG